MPTDPKNKPEDQSNGESASGAAGESKGGGADGTERLGTKRLDTERLPFEPSKGRKKKDTTPAKPAQKPEPRRLSPEQKASKGKPSAGGRSSRNPTLEETRIPDIVGKRMLRRMAVLSGVPSFLGVATFFVAYGLIKRGAFEFPNEFVLAVSLLFFGLGVVGLSYGVLSASWEEEMEGSLLGLEEFSLNWGRMRSAWREAREAKKG